MSLKKHVEVKLYQELILSLFTAMNTGILTEIPIDTSVLHFGNEVSEGILAVLASYLQF